MTPAAIVDWETAIIASGENDDYQEGSLTIFVTPASTLKKQSPTAKEGSLYCDHIDQRTLFILLCLGLYSSFLMRGILVESVMDKGFKFPWSSAVIESALAVLFSVIEMQLLFPKESMLSAVWSEYKMKLVISLSMTTAKGLTWVAFDRLSYPTTTMLKSCKLVTPMSRDQFFPNHFF